MDSRPTIWVFHDNCERSCAHCMCKPTPRCNVNETRELIDSLQRKGYKTKLYITDPGSEEVLSMVNLFGYTYMELKDKIDITFLSQLTVNSPELILSLHGHEAGLHELLCETGNFQLTMKAMKKAQNSNLRNLTINSVVHRRNYQYIEDLCDLVFKHGAMVVKFIKLGYAGRARKLPEDMFLDAKTCAEFFRLFERVKKTYRGRMEVIVDRRAWGQYYSKFTASLMGAVARLLNKQVFVCQAGFEKIAIHSKTKDVFPCHLGVANRHSKIGYYDERKGLVIEKSIYGGNRSNLLERIGEPCNHCKILRWCGGGCRGVAIYDTYQQTGNIDIYAGQPLCPIGLGVTPIFSAEEIRRVFRRVLSRVKHLLARPG